MVSETYLFDMFWSFGNVKNIIPVNEIGAIANAAPSTKYDKMGYNLDNDNNIMSRFVLNEEILISYIMIKRRPKLTIFGSKKGME